MYLQNITLKMWKVRSGSHGFTKYPTDPFTILEPQGWEIGEFYVVQEGGSRDFQAPKFWKGRSWS